ncbi:MAG: acylphosphatase [Gemmatimonadaceae bacterium]|jgi:acylphosphatase|nr:acylphosphatase [Gemmatimonadaceae bacterium]
MVGDGVLHVTVHGRVQGVGFRWFTLETATRLALRGWVRNQADGSVEVCAAGPAAALDALRDALHRGPRGAMVERVQPVVQEASDAAPTGAFTIRHD